METSSVVSWFYKLNLEQKERDMATYGFSQRMATIRAIWSSNRWLYGVIGFFLGFVTPQIINSAIKDFSSFLDNLVPEAIGIIVTVGFIDTLYRQREEDRQLKDLQNQLILNAGSTVNAVAKDAIHQLQKRGWLDGEDGLLKGADLRNANLEGANLISANLINADLSGANLQNGHIAEGNLQSAILVGMELQNANMRLADMEGVDLSHAKLQNSNLMDANLAQAKMWHADFHGAKLFRTILIGADMLGAKLQDTDLAYANLRNTNLFDANFENANLVCADMTGADLTQANLKSAILWQGQSYSSISTKFDSETILPDGTKFKTNVDALQQLKPFLDGSWKPY